MCNFCTDVDYKGNKWGVEIGDTFYTNKGKFELELEISNKATLDITTWNRESGEEFVINDTIEIQYCPFCGRKLKEESNENKN